VIDSCFLIGTSSTGGAFFGSIRHSIGSGSILLSAGVGDFGVALDSHIPFNIYFMVL